METYLQKIVAVFQANGDPKLALEMEAYMKNQFKMFGIKTPERRKLGKPIVKEIGPLSFEQRKTLIEGLWERQERECHYFAIDYLVHYAKSLEERDIDLLEYMILNHSWWDTVDIIASKLVGHLFAEYPEMKATYGERWSTSENMWLRRVALLYQLKYKEKTDEAILYKYIERNSKDEDFFIRKAIGWMLREYSKTNPDSVREFMKRTELSSLSVKEGSKYL